MRRRVHTYYKRFLELHVTDDLNRARIKVAVTNLEKQLLPTGVKTGTKGANVRPSTRSTIQGTSVDVLKLIDPTKHAVGDKWSKVGGVLRNSGNGSISDMARIRLPVEPKGDYHLSVRFRRIAGTESMNLILPVGNSNVLMVFDGFRGGNVSKMLAYRGRSPNGPPTSRKDFIITTGTVYDVGVTVRTKGTQAQIDYCLVDLLGQRPAEPSVRGSC